MLLQPWVSPEAYQVPHPFSSPSHFANPALQLWFGGEDIDLECGIGLSVGSHRDLMLRPGEVMSIYNRKCIQAPVFCLRK